jgi:hypothetical protein
MGRECTTNGGRGINIGYWWESQKEIDHKNLDIGERRALRRILEKSDGVVWMD